MSILQTKDLKKYYGMEPNITHAFDGVDFCVEQGEFVAVVGTSGSGKSTLLHMASNEFNQTVVMITHNNDIARLADRIVRIEDGRIVG